MKNYNFRNPINEALDIQGKRWTVTFIVTIALLAMLSVAAFVVGMPICGSIAIVVAMLSSGYFLYWFGVENVTVEEE